MGILTESPVPHCLFSSDPSKQAKRMNAAFVNLPQVLRFPLPDTFPEIDQDLENMLGNKKLYLVLDLDHTLLHSIQPNQLTQQERDMYDHTPHSIKATMHALHGCMITKLRPFVHTFLREANKQFDMYICTLGTRAYAFDMLKVLDPNKEYFTDDSKVIAREDCPGNTKTLDSFLRNKESAVVIIDDTKQVWKNGPNLLVPDEYRYFQYSLKPLYKDENWKSYSVSIADESEDTGTLANALNILQRIHAEFFEGADQNKDVRQLLWKMFRPQIQLLAQQKEKQQLCS